MHRDAQSFELEQLTLSRWFRSLPPRLQQEILTRSRVRSCRKGELLITEGDPPRGLYGLLHGRTRHVRAVGDGDEVLMHIGEPGLWFGEYPLLSGLPSVGSVISDTSVRVLFLPAEQYERIVDAEPRYYRHFNRLLCERFALCYRFLAEAQALAPEAWLLSRLVGIAEVQQGEGIRSGPTTIAMSQAALANMVGISRQSLNALLARLQGEGMVEVGYRCVRLLQ